MHAESQIATHRTPSRKKREDFGKNCVTRRQFLRAHGERQLIRGGDVESVRVHPRCGDYPVQIAVIGAVMRDEIHTWRGERRVSFGGILYNLKALAAMTGPGDRVRPFCFAAREDLIAIRDEHFRETPHVDFATALACDAGTDENVLRYRSPSSRDEVMTLRTPSLGTEHLDRAREADAILVNFINGREIARETLAELRAETEAHIHLDIHNLGKTVDDSGRLTPKGLPDWREWLELIDTVQANEWEVQLVTGKKPETVEEYEAAALEFLSVPTLKAAAVTVGGAGSVLAHRLAEDGRPRVLRIPALDVDDVIDTTGCGDSYSSGFVTAMLRTGNPARAGLVASALSGLNTRAGGLASISGRSEVETAAKTRFPELYTKIENGWMGETV